jgi:integrase
LSKQGYADRSIFLELTLLKSIIARLIDEGHLPRGHAFKLPLTKPKGTVAYCYSREQVAAMVDHCQATIGLMWLGNVIMALACTGMRISELAGLRWSDIDFRSMVDPGEADARHALPHGRQGILGQVDQDGPRPRHGVSAEAGRPAAAGVALRSESSI